MATNKLKKLAAMSPQEIAFRLRRSIAERWERHRYRSGWYAWSESQWQQRLCAKATQKPANQSDSGSWWQQHMNERVEPVMLLASDQLAASSQIFQARFPERIEQVVANAEAVCEGKISFLGIETTLQDPIRWHLDTKSGYRWPESFHGDIDPYFCREGRGDVKYVWELGRQEYLIDCAKAFQLTGDTRFAKQTVDVVDSWIRANPFLQGVHWASALEVAVRALSWLWCYQFCRGQAGQMHLAWIKSFYQHGYYLHRHLSYYSSPNNHLIGEAAALYLLGCFFPEFDEAASWRSRGWSVLVEHHGNQYYQDGGSTEQATFYHNYCLGFLLLAVLVRQRRGESVEGKMLDAIERALEFTMWMTRGDGTVPRFGDVDNARSIRFENPPLWDFRNLLCLGATMFRRVDMKAVAGSFSEDALWLLSVEEQDRYEQLEADVPQETSKAFPDSGYYIMRSGWQEEDHHLAFDCGPIAGGLHSSAVPSSAHGHSDLMSFTLSVFGKPLLVDGGFYTYDEGPDWHRYFREASAHNTVLVDGASHARFHPSNAWSTVATPGPISWESTSLFEYVECDHAGFCGVDPPVRHRRSIYWDRQNDWLVLDRLEGTGEHEIEIYFHFAPGVVELRDDRRGLMVQSECGIFASLQLMENVPLDVQVVQSGEGPDGGWIGTGYGMRQQAPIVRFFGRTELPTSLSFSIQASQMPLAEPSRESGRAHIN